MKRLFIILIFITILFSCKKEYKDTEYKLGIVTSEQATIMLNDYTFDIDGSRSVKWVNLPEGIYKVTCKKKVKVELYSSTFDFSQDSTDFKIAFVDNAIIKIK